MAMIVRTMRPMHRAALSHRPAAPEDAPACIALRGRTRQNAIPVAQLAAYGITAASWAEGIRSGDTPGHVCLQGDALVGYCFGDRHTGEVLVLALLPEFEGRGLGRDLLARVVQQLAGLGWPRLYLGCSTDPASRSHGFYRHLGWQPTGQPDGHGDEILELLLPRPA
jgi:GNAT superfamily N-acetyltransferase